MRLIGLLIAGLVLAAFIAFSNYSLQHVKQQPQSMSEFVNKQLAEYKSPSLHDRQAKALKELYSITDNEVAQPVILFK